MSGGGGYGGGEFGGGGSGGSGPIACDKLIFTAHLQAVNNLVLPSLFENDVLEVAIDGVRVAAVHPVGTAGYIAEHMADLRRCIQAGVIFQATIVEILQSSVKVSIAPQQIDVELG